MLSILEQLSSLPRDADQGSGPRTQRILDLMADGLPRSATQIAAQLTDTTHRISYALRRLTQAGRLLISGHVDGRKCWPIYQRPARPVAVGKVKEVLDAMGGQRMSTARVAELTGRERGAIGSLMLRLERDGFVVRVESRPVSWLPLP